MKYTSCLFCVLLLLIACNGQLNSEERKAVRNEMNEREIKRITPGELIQTASNRGKKVADMAQTILLQSSFAHPDKLLIQELSESNTALFDSLNQNYIALTRWVGSKVLDQPNQLNSMEKQLLDAYLFNIENELEINENVQAMGNDSLLYTNPVMLSKWLELSGDTTEQDNTRKDQLLGMWSIKLSKRAIILAM